MLVSPMVVCQWIKTLSIFSKYNIVRHRRTQDFTMEAVHVVGAWPVDLET